MNKKEIENKIEQTTKCIALQEYQMFLYNNNKIQEADTVREYILNNY